MAQKSALPLLLVAGAAALYMAKKKKKKAKPETAVEFPTYTMAEGGYIGDLKVGPEGKDKLFFDAECQKFAEMLNADAHNTYITGMFHDLVGKGVNTAEGIALAMLKDQASHCPWDESASYTELMTGVFHQLVSAISGYAEITRTPLAAPGPVGE